MIKTRWFHSLIVFSLLILVSCQTTTVGDDEEPAIQSTPLVKPTPTVGVLIDITAPDTELGVGEFSVVTVTVHRVEDLMGVEVHLQFDPVLVQVQDAEPTNEGVQISQGDFLQPDFIAINNSDNESGNVDFAVAQMPTHKAVEGSGSLCQIRVKAVAPGVSEFKLTSVILADSKGQQIPLILVNDTLKITSQ